MPTAAHDCDCATASDESNALREEALGLQQLGGEGEKTGREGEKFEAQEKFKNEICSLHAASAACTTAHALPVCRLLLASHL